MYAPGHVGIALLVFAPLGTYLLANGRVRLAASGAAVASLTATLPDLDQYLTFLPHRGITHTLAFAILGGAAFGVLAVGVSTTRRERRAAVRTGAWVALTVALSAVSHLLGDVVTPMGISPLAPVSDAHVTLSLVYARNPQVNAVLLAAGGVTTAAYWWVGIGDARRAAVRRALRAALLGIGSPGMGRGVVRRLSALLGSGLRR